MPVLTTCLRLIATALLLLSGSAAVAQTPSVAALSLQLRQAEVDLRAVDASLDDRVDADAQKALRSRALAAQQVATDVTSQLQQQETLIDARIAGLGPITPGVSEPLEISVQRKSLAQQRSVIDSSIKRGGLANVEAGQLLDEIDRSRAEQFNEKITAQVASPVTPAFWRAIVQSLPRDLRRTGLFVSQGTQQIRAQWHGSLPWQMVLGIILGLVLLFPVRVRARSIGQRLLVESAPGHRVRRSANALWRVIVGTLAPLLAAAALAQGLRWSGLLPTRWSSLLDAFVSATGFCAYTAAVSGALLMRNGASWRVAPIDDETASALRPLSWVLAGLSFASIVVGAFNTAIGASQAALIATQALNALLHLLLIIVFLVVLGRLRAKRAETEEPQNVKTSAGIGLGTLLAWVLVATALVGLLLGYIALSLFVAWMIAWATVLGTTLYLLTAAVDDVATSMFVRDSRLGVTLTRALGVRPSMVDQFGVLLSAFLRVALVLVALSLLVTPFVGTTGFGTVFGRLGVLAQGVEFGGVSIAPANILRGIVVLFIGLALVRGFMGWLETRYLPITDLDGSGRNSVSLVARYVGIAVAFIWALASLGIGVERVALLLSALSVGIGFGLQAITQNFVSGLILLAERPIKIGDLVRVGNDEGDVKRISVRSTEIELPDHSTLIVPNSELITKSVLNKTLSNPLGRIQIKFSVPLESDAPAVKAMVHEAFAGESAVLDDPAPAVFIDAIMDGRIEFNCFGHVVHPRAAYAARSAVLMTLLERFRKEGIDIGTVPQRIEWISPQTLAPPATD
ncbi:DUF3772 domain-containing protein [Sphingomonas sp. CARO-RG-8B-R24-01]|uniref:DUF3772 domain-containing protein n=1 Tax=Sphingomonas sp. CARO-RG-8B-R24-01 TaxID=2914831 RepID=UPI001F55C0DF|nr:DUF3772 domain-containing protein [Sphingomonas sp. CARO-RG-8B-R24-01]